MFTEQRVFVLVIDQLKLSFFFHYQTDVQFRVVINQLIAVHTNLSDYVRCKSDLNLAAVTTVSGTFICQTDRRAACCSSLHGGWETH